MKNHRPMREDVKTKELPPKVEPTPKGVVILCPFCQPSHPILPGIASPCGTTLKVTAVQVYYPSHTTRRNKIHCIKCGQIGGEMIKYRDGFVHTYDCNPGTKLLTEIPPLSRWAKSVFNMPARMRKAFEKRYGTAKELQEIDAEGKQTGKVLGYFFWKG